MEEFFWNEETYFLQSGFNNDRRMPISLYLLGIGLTDVELGEKALALKSQRR